MKKFLLYWNGGKTYLVSDSPAKQHKDIMQEKINPKNWNGIFMSGYYGTDSNHEVNELRSLTDWRCGDKNYEVKPNEDRAKILIDDCLRSGRND